MRTCIWRLVVVLLKIRSTVRSTVRAPKSTVVGKVVQARDSAESSQNLASTAARNHSGGSYSRLTYVTLAESRACIDLYVVLRLRLTPPYPPYDEPCLGFPTPATQGTRLDSTTLTNQPILRFTAI